MARISVLLAVWLPEPLTVASVIEKSFTMVPRLFTLADDGSAFASITLISFHLKVVSQASWLYLHDFGNILPLNRLRVRKKLVIGSLDSWLQPSNRPRYASSKPCSSPIQNASRSSAGYIVIW